MSSGRDTSYLAGALLGAIEDSLCDHQVHSPLCACLYSLHLNSSYPVSFPLTFVISLTHFPFPLLPPSTLSNSTLSSPFQSAWYFTPSSCEKKEIGREATETSFYFFPLDPFTLLFANIPTQLFPSSLLSFLP